MRYALVSLGEGGTTVEVSFDATMHGQQNQNDPRASAQIVALGIHAITDRFSAHEEAFGRRLKESALELIEETVLYERARTRDAAGTVQLLHRLIDRAEGMQQLLSFIKHRGLARPATVDNLDFEITQLLQQLKREDARYEEHVSRMHPEGQIIESHPVPQAPVQEASKPAPEPTVQHAAEQQAVTAPAVEEQPLSFDPLLGPDEVVAMEREMQNRTATALLEKDQQATAAVEEEVAAASVAQTKPETAEEKSDLTDRQRKILGIFHRETEAPLKRIMEVLPMFSEKTLRNDLKALVGIGKIKRVGRAPRSKYVLHV